MKICLIGPTYPFRGGISHYTTLLYRHLKKRHDTRFFSFKRQYPEWLFPGRTDIDPSQTHIKEEGDQKILDSLNPISWLRVACKIIKLNPDLLIIPWWVSFWTLQFWTISLLVKVFSKSQILFLCHNVVEHESKWIDKIATIFVLKNGDYFIVHSNEDQQNLLSMFPKAKLRKSFHPTYDIFNFGDFDPDTVKKKYEIESNIILFFGFVREYKGLKYLIKALSEVLTKINVTLLIVGEFWKDKDEYLHLINTLGIKDKIVIIDDYVPNEDVGLYFSAADLVVQPYVSATGSGIIQIAFGFGKPVIATKVGCLSEVVEDGKTGYLVPPESPHELAEAIVKYFSEGNVEIFDKNVKKENYKFSWDRMVNIIESFQQES
jgi:glycosyltransferase involved in cell wall biosynthesis